LSRVRLLVTRPEPDGERTAALLRSRGHEVLTLPMLHIEAIADAALGSGPWAAVLFTSANAVWAVAAHPRFGELVGLPAYAVGARTRAAAAAAGFAPVRSADGDVHALARLVAAELQGASLPLLHPAGDARAGDLAGALRQHGLAVATAVVYRSVMATDLSPELRDALALGAIDSVLHYSARTAAAFMAAVMRAGLRDRVIGMRHLALSEQVAEPLVAAGVAAPEVAREPNEAALLACIGAA
jgi:uroporphyrinogen-III synthase